MTQTFGYEIEFHIRDLDCLAKYLKDYSPSLKSKFGVDGAGISTGEIRSEVFNSLNELEIDLVSSMYKMREYKPSYKSFIVRYLKGQLSFLTNSVHISLGKEVEIDYVRLLLCFHVIYPIWLLYKKPGAFLRFMARKIMYPEILKIHPERVELRFLSSELPLTSLWVIRFIVVKE